MQDCKGQFFYKKLFCWLMLVQIWGCWEEITRKMWFSNISLWNTWLMIYWFMQNTQARCNIWPHLVNPNPFLLLSGFLMRRSVRVKLFCEAFRTLYYHNAPFFVFVFLFTSWCFDLIKIDLILHTLLSSDMLQNSYSGVWRRLIILDPSRSVWHTINITHSN